MFIAAGGNQQIARQTDQQSLVVGATEGGAGVANVQGAAGLQIEKGAGTGARTIAVYAHNLATGTFAPLYNADGAVTFDVIDDVQVFDLPEAVFSCHFIKLVSDAAFTVTLLAKG